MANQNEKNTPAELKKERKEDSIRCQTQSQRIIMSLRKRLGGDLEREKKTKTC